MKIWRTERQFLTNVEGEATFADPACIRERPSPGQICSSRDADARLHCPRGPAFPRHSNVVFETEAALLSSAERQPSRAASQIVLFDSRGDLLSSTDFARLLGRLRDDGTQRLLLGIGPADGWSAAALGRAQRTVSLGRMTLPHELARAVAAEQIYRAFTILAGHPYHSGH